MVKRKARAKRRQAGYFLPNEGRRRSLVTVEVHTFNKEADTFGVESENYIVETRRVDGQWQHFVEFKGISVKLPGRVVDRMMAQRKAIVKELQRRNALGQAQAIVEKAQKVEP